MNWMAKGDGRTRVRGSREVRGLLTRALAHCMVPPFYGKGLGMGQEMGAEG